MSTPYFKALLTNVQHGKNDLPNSYLLWDSKFKPKENKKALTTYNVVSKKNNKKSNFYNKKHNSIYFFLFKLFLFLLLIYKIK